MIAADRFTLLVVCSGNICRSPTAEALLRDRLHALAAREPAPPGVRHTAAVVDVSSAGTVGLVGHPMDATCALALRELGSSLPDHRARRLDATLVSGADLVLTADTAQRRQVVIEVPLAFRRAFTLREFARLARALDDGRAGGHPGGWDDAPAGAGPGSVGAAQSLRDRVRSVADARGRVDAPPPGADDIGDPFGAGLEAARAAATAVSEAVDGVLSGLGLVPAGD